MIISNNACLYEGNIYIDENALPEKIRKKMKKKFKSRSARGFSVETGEWIAIKVYEHAELCKVFDIGYFGIPISTDKGFVADIFESLDLFSIAKKNLEELSKTENYLEIQKKRSLNKSECSVAEELINHKRNEVNLHNDGLSKHSVTAYLYNSLYKRFKVERMHMLLAKDYNSILLWIAEIDAKHIASIAKKA